MTADRKISSFDESGYFFGPLESVSYGELERQTELWFTEETIWPANLHERFAPPISAMLTTILQEAVLAKAAFIHIEPRGREYLVRYRIGDKLWEANAYPSYKCPSLYARLKAVSGINIAERRVPQFGRFLYQSQYTLHEMRLSTVPTRLGEAFVINVLLYMGKGDYSTERHTLLDPLTQEDILTQIGELQKGTTE